MFNSVYEITACGKSYVLKTAPSNAIKVMTYEKICFPPSFFGIKKKSIKYHNEISNVKIELNRESKIRLAFACGLGAMIMEIERYYRFKPFSQGWFVDISGSKMMYNTAFKVLENEK